MKIVLVSQRVDVIESYNERRDALDQKWAEFLFEAGYIAMPLPNYDPALKELLQAVSLKKWDVQGIVLSGGNSPVAYGGSAPERDNTDNLLIDFSVKYKIPLLGVCRGMQSIALYFGGTLRKVKNHVAVRHDIGVNRKVNSYHEYAPDTLPGTLSVLAKTGEGVIEHIKHNTLPIIGIMWHPEREVPFSQEDIELVNSLFKFTI